MNAIRLIPRNGVLAIFVAISSMFVSCDSAPYYYFPERSQSYRGRSVVRSDDSPLQNALAYYDFNGDARDQSGNGHDGILYGPSFVSDRYNQPGSAIHFDGIDDYLDVLNSELLKVNLPVTLSAWINLDQNENTTGVLTTDFSFRLNTGVFLAFDSNGANPSISIGSGGTLGSSSRRTRHANIPLDTGTWYHIVGVVHTAQEQYIYVNGVDVSGRTSGGANSLIYSQGPVSMGRRTASREAPPIFYSGALDDVAIFGQALTPDEVYDLYTVGIVRDKERRQ